MSINKAKAGLGAAAAMAVTAVTIATVPNTTEIEGNYNIMKVNPYRAEIRITVPEEFTPDIVTLKMNDMEVAKTLLPQGYIVTYPVVVSDTDRLSMDMYVRGEEAATAEFDADGKLIITVKDKYLSGAEQAENGAEQAENGATPTDTPTTEQPTTTVTFENVLNMNWSREEEAVNVE